MVQKARHSHGAVMVQSWCSHGAVCRFDMIKCTLQSHFKCNNLLQDPIKSHCQFFLENTGQLCTSNIDKAKILCGNNQGKSVIAAVTICMNCLKCIYVCICINTCGDRHYRDF